MAKPLPAWFDRAKGLKPYEALVVETDAKSQHGILSNLRKIDGSFKTRRIPGGFRVERVA